MRRLMGVLGGWSVWFGVFLILFCEGAESRPSLEHNHHGSTSNMDINTMKNSLVFNIEDMRGGSKKEIYFAKKEDSVDERFISREMADSIPFSHKDLPMILDLLGLTRGSLRASQVESTLKACESPPASEVFKACFTSFEAMFETITRIFNVSTSSSLDRPSLMTTVLRGPHKMTFQNYTVLGEPHEVPITAMAGCHGMSYPYAVFYCHIQPGETKVFQIPLLGERDGVHVDALGVCHLDTSQWSPMGWAFQALGTKPGHPVCHFFPPYGNFVWVHTLENQNAST